MDTTVTGLGQQHMSDRAVIVLVSILGGILYALSAWCSVFCVLYARSACAWLYLRNRWCSRVRGNCVQMLRCAARVAVRGRGARDVRARASRPHVLPRSVRWLRNNAEHHQAIPPSPSDAPRSLQDGPPAWVLANAAAPAAPLRRPQPPPLPSHAAALHVINETLSEASATPKLQPDHLSRARGTAAELSPQVERDSALATVV